MSKKPLIALSLGIAALSIYPGYSWAEADRNPSDALMHQVEQDLSKIDQDPDAMKALASMVAKELGKSPVRVTGAVTIRYDSTTVENDRDLVTDTTRDGYRTRTRLGALFVPDGPEGVVTGGIRISTGEDSNPTSPFLRFGNSFRSNSFNLDQYWIGIRPLKFYDKEIQEAAPGGVTLIGGSMPQPFWRGDWGNWRSEMIFDNDISPQGVVIQAKAPHVAPEVTVEATGGYFVIQETDDLRFVGQTADVALGAGQVKAEYEPIGALSAAFYVFNNLNDGLFTPNLNIGSGADVMPGQPAILLRDPGFQRTNNQVAYGPGSIGFIEDRFSVFNLIGQVHYDLPFLAVLQNPQVFFVGDYINNVSVSKDTQGFGFTLGVRGGKQDSGVNPLHLWVTFRNVDNDATIATFADSDLGAGTGYHGIQLGANYRLHKHLLAQITGYEFDGYPFKDNNWSRVFCDLTLDF